MDVVRLPRLGARCAVIYDTHETDVPYEAQPTFDGECGCPHPTDEHGWGSCAVENCPCEAGWIE